eukprot:432656_1
MSDNLIKQIDKALSRYYTQRNSSFVDDDGNNKFVGFCEANGFYDDDVQQELQVDPEDCMIIDFDENFPFHKNIKPQEKNKFIFDILVKCANDPEAFTVQIDETYLFTIQQEDFKVNDETLDTVLATLQESCPIIFGKEIENKDLITLLSIGENINQPYLHLLADTYARDRVNHYLEIKTILKQYEEDINQLPIQYRDINVNKLQVNSWMELNAHTKKIKNWSKHHQQFDLLQSAIRSYYHRICPLMDVAPTFKIQDNYEEICELISGAVDFVYNLTTSPFESGICSFQLDFCIAFNNVKQPTTDEDTVMYDDAVMYDDDDVTDHKDEKKHEKKDENAFFDCFCNIKEKLEQAGLIYVSQKVTTSRHLKFKPQFTQLATKLKPKLQKETNEFPRRFRFVSILDRRNSKEGDELIFAEPPQDCFKFPEENKRCDDLWYFNSSKTCIIPKDKNYNDKDEDKKRKLKTEIINTDHPMNNGMLTLSFHVVSKEEIRCYMYIGGRMMRFVPENLKLFLPQFFSDSEYKSSEDLDLLIKNMNSKLVDARFNSFYHSNKTDIDALRQNIKMNIETTIENLARQASTIQQKANIISIKVDNIHNMDSATIVKISKDA